MYKDKSERNVQICQMLRNGELYSVITEKFGVSKSTVSQLAVKNGLERKPRTPRLTKNKLLERNVQICQMLRNGELHSVIAKNFGVSERTVSYLADKHGIRRNKRTPRLSKNELIKRNVQICQMLRNEEVHSVIAEKFGVTQPTVSNLAVKHGLTRRTRKPRLTKNELIKRNVQIIEMLKNGKKHKVIAEKLGVTQKTVSKLAVKHGLTRHTKPPRLTKNELIKRNVQIIEMLKNGELHRVIAKKLGVSVGTVSHIAVKHGLRRRNLQ